METPLKRISYAQILTKYQETDAAFDDDLGQAQRELQALKNHISEQSKENFILERDVRYLDGRIALLIMNRMQLDDPQFKDSDPDAEPTDRPILLEERKLQLYSNLFFLLQSEPRHIATLSRLVGIAEIDTLLQTVMFTLYGNQYDSREEHLLLSMFQLVLAHQFETATDFGNLLRANTPVSRMMTTYTRRGPGQAYLKNLLTELVSKLIKHKTLNLEINPLRVHEQVLEETQQHDEEGNGNDSGGGGFKPIKPVLTMEESMEIPAVQQLITPRIAMLKQIADSFLNTIIASLDDVPYGIRWICKQIKGLSQRKYPEATDWEICSLIGGFFMLRYTNPAIVTPSAFMSVPEAPQKCPRRTLTLLAKMLQNLSNKPSHQKEPFMSPLADWAEKNKGRIKKFYWDLCEVGDFYDSLELDQYVALSKKDMKIQITINEIFNMHELLHKHRGVLATSEETQMRHLMSSLGEPLPQVPRNLNRKMELALFSRWETKIQDPTEFLQQSTATATGVQEQQSTELQYLEAKSIFVTLMRRFPGYLKPKPGEGLDLMRFLDRVSGAREEDVKRKVRRVTELLGNLAQLGFVSPETGYRRFIKDVQQEIAHLGDTKANVNREMKSLQEVLSTISEHNEYLRSQLETYKAYLANVRRQTAGGSSQPGGSPGKEGKHSNSNGHSTRSRNPLRSGNSLPFKDSPFSSSKGFAQATVPTHRFSHSNLDKDRIISESRIPEHRRPNVYIAISSPSPGMFLVSFELKGREAPFLEIDLRLDDLLEKQEDGMKSLDVECVVFHVPSFVKLLNKYFLKR